ncbi:hypothetical protein OG900_10095 [Streptomyces sp. NBC_00433]
MGGDLNGRMGRLIDDAGQWALSKAAWRRVRTLLTELETALARGDRAAANTAVSRLELLSPGRATRLGDEPRVPADRAVRERLNRVRAASDSLGPLPAPDDPEPPPVPGTAQGGRRE